MMKTTLKTILMTLITLQSCGCATMSMIEQTGVSHERDQNIRQAYTRTNQILFVYEAEVWHDSTARPSGPVTRYAVVDLSVPILTNEIQTAISRGRPSKSELSEFQQIAVISDYSGLQKTSWIPWTNTLAVRTHAITSELPTPARLLKSYHCLTSWIQRPQTEGNGGARCVLSFFL